MMEFQSEELFNIPDTLFSKFCEEKFGVNKGVYNTIDHWFHQQGLTSIVNRRKMIILFCQSVHCNENKKVKFGHGGLTPKLNMFLHKYL